jgi:hypothetical protein
MDDVGAKLIAKPNRVADELHRLDVQIGASQIALLGAFVDDKEGNFTIRIVHEYGT